MIKIDNQKLHKHVLSKLRKMEIPQRQLCSKQGFSRSSLHRLNRGKPITLELFFILINWLDADPNQYLIKEYISITGKRTVFNMAKYQEQNK